jgi:pimeloyl-ACP methyl ester carboxylesterase
MMKKIFLLMLTLVSLLSLAGISFAHGENEVTETVITLENGVVGTLALPASDAPVPAVLMLHGFASMRDEVGDMFKRLAAELGERGIASLRIDFRGWGESAGAMTDSTVSGMVEDAAAAYAVLSTTEGIDAGRIGVLGFSLGGSIAVFAAGEHPNDYQSLAIWSAPASLLDAYIDGFGQEVFDTAAAEGEVTVDLGFRTVTLSDDFFTSLEAYDYQEQFAGYSGAFLVVAGSEDSSAAFLDWYRENAPGDLKASYSVEGADHIYNVLTADQTNSSAVIEKTADWFVMSL